MVPRVWAGVPLDGKRPQQIPAPSISRLPTPHFCGSVGKESVCNVGDLGSIPRLGRSPGEGKGYPLQYSGLENFMDCIVHRVAKSQTCLRDFHFHCQGCSVSLRLTPFVC